MTLDSAEKFSFENAEFMTWANYTNDKNNTAMNPLMDLLGPTVFHPFSCYGQSLVALPIAYIDTDERKRPIIAYIKNDNDIEKEFIEYLESVVTIKEGILGYVDIILGILEKFEIDINNIAGGGDEEESSTGEGSESAENLE
mmetsp:Transcript_25898/g.18350  ORF Transcript_25898/g.18350 Transcript_25898/m.18350 type:complete len:142 (-) Transcript_25898:1034-1459(-)